MKSEMSRYHYRLRSAIDYAKKQGKPVKALTEEEWGLFRGAKKTFEERCWALTRKHPCVVCKNDTGFVEEIHVVSVCSEACLQEVDERIDKGETLSPNRKIQNLLHQIEEDLFD